MQVKGVAIGTNTSSSYATIYMEIFEKTFIYPCIKGLYKAYLRYIDNIFRIRTDNKERFAQFIEKFNQKHPSIQFDLNISAKEVDFLDITIYIDRNNKLNAKLYRKLINRQNQLQRKAGTSRKPLR